MSLHYQLATLRKGDNSIADYYHKFTTLIDTLAVVDQPLPHHETLSFLLAGLGSDYDALVTSVSTPLTPIALEDLYGHLLSHELQLSHNQPSVDLSSASANFVNKTAPTEEVVEAEPIIFLPQEAETNISVTGAGVVDVTIIPSPPTGPFAKFVKSQDMWLYNVITGLITRINMTTLLK